MRVLVVAANILGCPLIHLVIAKITIRLPLTSFGQDRFPYAAWSWERNGEFYRKWLAIRRWKSLLPDGAPWLGGFAKKQLVRRDRVYLNVFIQETRRAEFAHWCMFFSFPVFFVWNPPWACWVMAGYAVIANAPCIIAQRYNRHILIRLVQCAPKASIDGPIIRYDSDSGL